jgi:hypothetical protein
VPLPTLARYDDELRRRLPAPPGLVREDAGPLTRIVGPTNHPLDWMVCHSRLSAADADDVARAEIEAARRAGRGLQWNVYDHDEPRDLVDRLVRLGLVFQNRETVVVLEADDERAHAAPSDGVVVRRVERIEDVGDFMAVQGEVWGHAYDDWVLRWFRASLAGASDPVGVFVAEVDGEPAGCAWVSLPRERSFALMFGATVVERRRRRGAYRALVAARARIAREHGARWLVADANERSRPLLEKIGFVPIAARTELVLAPAPSSTPVAGNP